MSKIRKKFKKIIFKFECMSKKKIETIKENSKI